MTSTTLVDVQDLEKNFPLSGGGNYLALKGIELEIRKGEFISLPASAGLLPLVPSACGLPEA